MLRFDKISHHYGLWPSIDDISLNIEEGKVVSLLGCLLYTSPSPRDTIRSRMPSSA